VTEKETKRIFVITPFGESPTLDEQALTNYFENTLENTIEDADARAKQ
jgi:hypothetical protein